MKTTAGHRNRVLDITEGVHFWHGDEATAKLQMQAIADMDSGNVSIRMIGRDSLPIIVGDFEILPPFLEGEVRAKMAFVLRRLADEISPSDDAKERVGEAPTNGLPDVERAPTHGNQVAFCQAIVQAIRSRKFMIGSMKLGDVQTATCPFPDYHPERIAERVEADVLGGVDEVKTSDFIVSPVGMTISLGMYGTPIEVHFSYRAGRRVMPETTEISGV